MSSAVAPASAGSTGSTAAPRFKGTSIDLGGTTYVVPPLALGAVKEFLPRIQAIRTLTTLPSADDLDTMVDVVHTAIARNYPDVTKEQLNEVLDLGNIKDVFRSVMGISGLKAKDSTSGNSEAGTETP